MRTRTALLLILLVGALLCVAGRLAYSQKGDPVDAYGAFYGLSRMDAGAKASAMAQEDFKQGRFRLLVYGLRPAKAPSEKYLTDHYGVEFTAIAGCVVSDGILGATNGYNATMSALLQQKFGKDIFKEAKTGR